MADLNSTIVRGKLRVTEDINANGNVTGSSIMGNGSGLTNLNASNIGSGTLSADRLATSGATAGSYGPSANATPAYGATFNVPYITVDNKGRVTKAETKTVKIPDNSNLVPYTGASKDVNLGNHSFTMSSVFTVGSESSVYTQTTPGSISLKNPIGTLSIGVSSLGVNGTTIYWPTVSGDPNGKYLALRSDIPDTSTFLDKGTSSTVVNQVVYNPVEMKKNLSVPSLSGEKTTIAGNSISTFGLGGTKDGSTAMSDLTLVGFSGTSSTDNVYTTHIQQLSNGTFQITRMHGKNVIDTLTHDGRWRMNGYEVFTEENCKLQQWKLTSTSGTVTTVNICVKK